jgi:hypothetical protein
MARRIANMTIPNIAFIADRVRSGGFAFAPAARFRAFLSPAALAAWPAFAASWSDLGADAYMADGGRYRRRRFAAFSVASAGILRKPHQPHYQSRDYNPLNGGVERWFEPVTPAIAAHPVTLALLDAGRSVFDSLAAAPPQWHVEMHQFRIEAREGEAGLPTPEGLHRDGVDFVLVVLVARSNVESGVTSIYDLDRNHLGDFTLTDPLDAVFLQDSRVFHGVTSRSSLSGRKTDARRRTNAGRSPDGAARSLLLRRDASWRCGSTTSNTASTSNPGAGRAKGGDRYADHRQHPSGSVRAAVAAARREPQQLIAGLCERLHGARILALRAGAEASGRTRQHSD